jgi:hypothetical protein
MYEPDFDEPIKELQVGLNAYRRLAREVTEYDEMEIVNDLAWRDGIKYSIEKLRDEMDVSDFLAEIKALDEKIIAKIPYIQEALDGYTVADEYNVSHWWWYLDAIIASEVKIEFNEETGMYEGILRNVSSAGALPDYIESRRF